MSITLSSVMMCHQVDAKGCLAGRPLRPSAAALRLPTPAGRRNRRMLRATFGLVLLAFLAGPSAARADFLTQTFKVPQQDTNIQQTLTVNSFDARLGTLRSVSFSVNGFFTSQMF